MRQKGVLFLHRLTALITLWAFAFTTLVPSHGALSQAPETFIFTHKSDALGRFGSVLDALGQTMAFSYDELGNTLTQVDALGRVSRYEYDVLGRRVKRVLPLGMFETMSYDAAGNVASRVDFKGRTTTFGYDSMNIKQ
jgi:YD repeat-containing protein